MAEFDDLRASFTLELGGADSIDSLCQTYLGDLDQIPTSSSSSFSSSPSLYTPDASSSSLYPPEQYSISPNPSSLSPYQSTGSLYPYSTSPNPSLSPYHASHSPNPSSLSLYPPSASLYPTSVSPNLSSLSPCPSTDSGLLDEMEAFSRMEVSEWRGEDCLDWAASVCRRRGVDQSTVDLWNFRSTTGAQLLQLTLNDFCTLAGSVYGPLFHDELQELRRNRKLDGRGFDLGCSGSPQYDLYDPLDLSSEDIKDLDRYIIGGLQDMDLESAGPLVYESLDNTPEPVALLSAGGAPSPPLTPALDTPSTPLHATDPLMKIRPDPKKRERGPKNWEFVIRLLADSSTNPSLIRWEDQSQGTFRLVQPSVIAKMWGKRADKPNLSYDNFARGLRYHYTTGALQPVSEKQLVYRCGPKALKFLIELKKTAGM